MRVSRRYRRVTRHQIKRALREISALHPSERDVYVDELVLVERLLGHHSGPEHKHMRRILRKMVKRGEVLVETCDGVPAYHFA